jgi:hypothetical protein
MRLRSSRATLSLARAGGRQNAERTSAVTKDIVSRIDCPGPPAAVWRALLGAAQFDEQRRTLTLPNSTVKVRSRTPGLGVRGRARWADVTYRVTAYLIPHPDGTRLVLTGAVDHASADMSSFKRLQARRLAARDLRDLTHATCRLATAQARLTVQAAS